MSGHRNTPIVDCHCHAGLGGRLDEPWTSPAPLRTYLARAEQAAISHTLVAPSFPDDSRAGNRELATILAAHPRRLSGLAWVDPRRDRGAVARLLAEAVGLGFVGIKVHGSRGSPTREVCDAARRFRLPILLDVVGRGHALELVAPSYRDVAFVVAHLGSFLDDWRAHLAVIDALQRHPNVYADTSGVRRFDYLVEAVRRAGSGKLLFGSDGIWLHPGLELHKVRLLGLDRAAEARILGGTALRLFGRRRPTCPARLATASMLT